MERWVSRILQKRSLSHFSTSTSSAALIVWADPCRRDSPHHQENTVHQIVFKLIFFTTNFNFLMSRKWLISSAAMKSYNGTEMSVWKMVQTRRRGCARQNTICSSSPSFASFRCRCHFPDLAASKKKKDRASRYSEESREWFETLNINRNNFYRSFDSLCLN